MQTSKVCSLIFVDNNAALTGVNVPVCRKVLLILELIAALLFVRACLQGVLMQVSFI